MISGTQRFKIVTDNLGSLRLVIRISDGAIVNWMDHDEFGKVIGASAAQSLPLGFAGGFYDSKTPLVRFGARDYDPEVGRFRSKDPILFGGGDTNLYGYVANDPVNWIDPTGLKIYDPQGLIPSWIKNTDFYKNLDSNVRPIFVGSGSLDGSYGTTSSAAFGLFQNITLDKAGHNGSKSNYCSNLSDYEDTVLHELYHANQNLNRFWTGGDGVESADMVGIPGFIQGMGRYKK